MPYWNLRAKEMSDLDRDLVLVDYANPLLSTAEIELRLGLKTGHIRRLKVTKNGKRLIVWAKTKGPPARFPNHAFTARRPVPPALALHPEFAHYVGVFLDGD